MVYMYHSFLIHSSADGRLGCFHVLAIINEFGLKSSEKNLTTLGSGKNSIIAWVNILKYPGNFLCIFHNS